MTIHRSSLPASAPAHPQAPGPGCDLALWAGARRTPIEGMLARVGLAIVECRPSAPIPGSYWGAPEAGLKATPGGGRLFVRADTPLHSLFHEACHYMCMDPVRRAALDTDAGGDYAEEDAVCCLQIVLADEIPELGRERMMADMDAWGYTFRLGSARAWFEGDAEDARAWLLGHGLLDPAGCPMWALRIR